MVVVVRGVVIRVNDDRLVLSMVALDGGGTSDVIVIMVRQRIPGWISVIIEDLGHCKIVPAHRLPVLTQR